MHKKVKLSVDHSLQTVVTAKPTTLSNSFFYTALPVAISTKVTTAFLKMRW